MLDTAMKHHKQFGNMRVGSIVDCLAAPRHAACVVDAGARLLRSRDVDVIVANQACVAWQRALAINGFIPGASNFARIVTKTRL